MGLIYFNATEHIVPILDIETLDNKSIINASYLGTGFFVDTNILITCRHVFDLVQKIGCVVLNSMSKNYVIVNLRQCIMVDNLDIVIIKIKDEDRLHKPLIFAKDKNIYLGKEIHNYSYISSPHPGYKVGVLPRFLKGYIQRQSKEGNTSYLELSFPVLAGMSGSPVLDNNAQIIGMLYKNYRSQVLEDYIEEIDRSDKDGTSKEIIKTHKVVDYALAIDFTEYLELILETIKKLKEIK